MSWEHDEAWQAALGATPSQSSGVSTVSFFFFCLQSSRNDKFIFSHHIGHRCQPFGCHSLAGAVYLHQGCRTTVVETHKRSAKQISGIQRAKLVEELLKRHAQSLQPVESVRLELLDNFFLFLFAKNWKMSQRVPKSQERHLCWLPLS